MARHPTARDDRVCQGDGETDQGGPRLPPLMGDARRDREGDHRPRPQRRRADPHHRRDGQADRHDRGARLLQPRRFDAERERADAARPRDLDEVQGERVGWQAGPAERRRCRTDHGERAVRRRPRPLAVPDLVGLGQHAAVRAAVPAPNPGDGERLRHGRTGKCRAQRRCAERGQLRDRQDRPALHLGRERDRRQRPRLRLLRPHHRGLRQRRGQAHAYRGHAVPQRHACDRAAARRPDLLRPAGHVHPSRGAVHR